MYGVNSEVRDSDMIVAHHSWSSYFFTFTVFGPVAWHCFWRAIFNVDLELSFGGK